MEGITPGVLKKKAQSLQNRNSRIIPPGPTSPGMITAETLKQTTLKRTPPPKPPSADAALSGISSVKLRPTGTLDALLRKDSQSDDTETPRKEPPAVKPKPSIKQKPEKLKRKPPLPIRKESLDKEDEEEDASDSRGDSGAETESISDQSESSVSSRGSKALRPLPTLKKLGNPPQKEPITPNVREEAKMFIAQELVRRRELNNNTIEEEPGEELYDDVAGIVSQNDEELYNDVEVITSTPAPPQNEAEEGEELYNDVVGIEAQQEGVEEEMYNDVTPGPSEDASEELYNDVEVLPATTETFGEDLYDDVDSVLKDSGLIPEGIKSTPTQPPQGGNQNTDMHDEEDEYELLPNEMPPQVTAPPLPAKPAEEVPKKSKKEVEREEKKRKKEMELQKIQREKEERELKKRKQLEEELMKKAKLTPESLKNPIKVCIAKCNAKGSGKCPLQVTEREVLYVIKEEGARSIVKNVSDRIGYVDSKNLEEQVEEDSYESIESVREKLENFQS